MNPTLELLFKRKSMRVFEEREIEDEVRAKVLAATLRAPTAGNMMLYSILDITDQNIKDTLAITCDNQPFIAQAPMVWIFLADYQRWYEYFIHSGVERLCTERKIEMRKPEEGDLFLACSDALIAAQNAVIAAESLGLGSCYIGDIMENNETHKELFKLPPLVFPIAMLVFGYPTRQQRDRRMTSRFDEKHIVFENQYHHPSDEDFQEMFSEREKALPEIKSMQGVSNFGQHMFLRKFSSSFSVEMSRSVREMVKAWLAV